MSLFSTALWVLLGVVLGVFLSRAWQRYAVAEWQDLKQRVVGLMDMVDTFVETKEAEIADHLAELAYHNHHVKLKGKAVDTAKDLRAKLDAAISDPKA